METIGNADSSGLEPMVRKLEYWQTLEREDRDALLQLPHKIRNFAQHHYIVRDSDRSEYCCVLLSGFAVRQKIVARGQRQILAIHMTGDLVDLQNSLVVRADHSVQMLTAGRGALIPRQEIQRIAFERPAVGKTLWLDTPRMDRQCRAP
jgi:CRP-like cAMP-binding protein